MPGFNQKNQKIVHHVYNLYNRIEREIVQKRKAEIETTPIGQELRKDLLTQLCIMNTPRSGIKIEVGNDAVELCNKSYYVRGVSRWHRHGIYLLFRLACP